MIINHESLTARRVEQKTLRSVSWFAKASLPATTWGPIGELQASSLCSLQAKKLHLYDFDKYLLRFLADCVALYGVEGSGHDSRHGCCPQSYQFDALAPADWSKAISL